MADRVGQQLGNYRLTRLLGRGGFADVYLGEHVHIDTQAAIKVLHAQLTSEDVEEFRTEARTLARLVHPQIVRLLDFGIQENTLFLVMEYAPNGSLRKRHPRGVILPLTTIVPYVTQIAEALQFAHDEKLIHRDIKPENILLGRRNEILLSDFGIAVLSRTSDTQSIRGMAGTPYYMAPEQFRGKLRRASDQYALGITVYEWLSGSPPFNGTPYELMGQHAQDPPPSLRQKIPTPSPAVEEVVLKALEKEPHMTYLIGRGGRVLFRSDWIDPPTIELVLNYLLNVRARRRVRERLTPFYAEFAGFRKNDPAEFQEGLKLAGQQAVDDFARIMQHWTELAKIPGRLDV